MMVKGLPDMSNKVNRKIVLILILQTIFIIGIFILTNLKEIMELF